MKTQKDLDRLNKQIADLQSRQTEVRKAHAQAKNGLPQQESRLSAELLAGGTGKDLIVTVSAERVRVTALEEAEKKADAELESLIAERVQIEQELAIAAYQKQVAEQEQTLLGCFNLLYQVEARLRDAPPPQMPRGYTRTRHEKHLRDMWDQLSSFSLYSWLREMERIAPEFMAQVRKAKGA